jgi:hypothetical protein
MICGSEIEATCLYPDCEQIINTGKPYSRFFKSYCYGRDCTNPDCQKARKYRYTQKIKSKIRTYQNPQFLTLTFRGNYPAIQETFDRVNQSWRAMAQWLRRNHRLRAYIKVIELGLRPNNQYYFHLHICIDANSLSNDQISKAWKRITGNKNKSYESYIVWIVNIKSDFYDYLVKYLVKGYYGLLGTKRRLISYWSTVKTIKIKKGKVKCPHCGSALFFPNIEILEEYISTYTQTTIKDSINKIP